MKIGIIGANGFLGSVLYSILSKEYTDVVGVNRQNYNSCVGNYDVIINVNGNSKKYWANNNPLKDFDASTVSVYKSMFDFPCNLYIFISSADVYRKSAYGFNKLLAEAIVREYQENFIVLRCSAIVGKGLKKGIIYDVMNGSDLFVTKDSCIQFISANDISAIIKRLLNSGVKNTAIDVGGCGTTSMSYIESLLNSELVFSPQATCQHYEMNVNKLKKIFSLKTSNYYVKEIINERME